MRVQGNTENQADDVQALQHIKRKQVTSEDVIARMPGSTTNFREKESFQLISHCGLP